MNVGSPRKVEPTELVEPAHFQDTVISADPRNRLEEIDPLDAANQAGSPCLTSSRGSGTRRRVLAPTHPNVVQLGGSGAAASMKADHRSLSAAELAVDMRENFHIGHPIPFYGDMFGESLPKLFMGSSHSGEGEVPSQPGRSRQIRSPNRSPRNSHRSPSKSVTGSPQASIASDFSRENDGETGDDDDDDRTPVVSLEKRPLSRLGRCRNKVPSLDLGRQLGLMHQNQSTTELRTPRLMMDTGPESPGYFGADNDASPLPSHSGSRVAAPAIGGMGSRVFNPRWPPPTKVRRTQSMFATPEQLLQEQLAGEDLAHGLEEPASVLSQAKCPIATFPGKGHPFRCISRDTLCELLDGKHRQLLDEVVVVDCRFEYEYQGGHIQGAINISSTPKLEHELLHKNQQEIEGTPHKRRLVVFHCEHSAYRGPFMAAHLRHCDRQINFARYPHLHYPDIVILDGGYSHFYAAHGSRCWPQNYVEMNDQQHRIACEREMSRFRSSMRPRKQSSIRSASHESLPGMASLSSFGSSESVSSFGPKSRAPSSNSLSNFKFPN